MANCICSNKRPLNDPSIERMTEQKKLINFVHTVYTKLSVKNPQDKKVFCFNKTELNTVSAAWCPVYCIAIRQIVPACSNSTVGSWAPRPPTPTHPHLPPPPIPTHPHLHPERRKIDTVDSAMAASQTGFLLLQKLSIHKKTNVMQIMKKNIKFFINLIFIIEKLRNQRCSRCKIHRFVAAPLLEGQPLLHIWLSVYQQHEDLEGEQGCRGLGELEWRYSLLCVHNMTQPPLSHTLNCKKTNTTFHMALFYSLRVIP